MSELDDIGTTGQIYHHLRQLTGAGWTRSPRPTAARTTSTYHEYVLTPKGKALFPVIVALRQWGEGHFFAPGEPHSEMTDRTHGRPLRALEVYAADGRRLGPEDAVVRKVGGGEGGR